MCCWKSLLDRGLADYKHLEFVNRGLKARCLTIFLKIPKVQESFCRDERPRHTSHEVFFTSIAQFVLYRFNFSRAYFHNAT